LRSGHRLARRKKEIERFTQKVEGSAHALGACAAMIAAKQVQPDRPAALDIVDVP
jgi:glutamine amidotransferase PdxT